jgi:signal transduction histidine kinase
MRSIILGLIFVFFSFSSLAASETPTKKDAESFVKGAVVYLKMNGRKKFLNEVTSSYGKFHFQEGTNKGLYLFVYDEKGNVLAHGSRLELNGRYRWNDKDPDGKYWIRDWTYLVHTRGKGWTTYKEYNPANNNKLMLKTSYVTLVDEMIIGCGIYK